MPSGHGLTKWNSGGGQRHGLSWHRTAKMEMSGHFRPSVSPALEKFLMEDSGHAQFVDMADVKTIRAKLVPKDNFYIWLVFGHSINVAERKSSRKQSGGSIIQFHAWASQRGIDVSGNGCGTKSVGPLLRSRFSPFDAQDRDYIHTVAGQLNQPGGHPTVDGTPGLIGRAMPEPCVPTWQVVDIIKPV